MWIFAFFDWTWSISLYFIGGYITVLRDLLESIERSDYYDRLRANRLALLWSYRGAFF